MGWGLTLLQRSSRCILQPQSTGQNKEFDTFFKGISSKVNVIVFCGVRTHLEAGAQHFSHYDTYGCVGKRKEIYFEFVSVIFGFVFFWAWVSLVEFLFPTPSLFSRLLEIVLSAPTMTSITVTFIFHNFLKTLWRGPDISWVFCLLLI